VKTTEIYGGTIVQSSHNRNVLMGGKIQRGIDECDARSGWSSSVKYVENNEQI
jgi:hypothetical protein